MLQAGVPGFKCSLITSGVEEESPHVCLQDLHMALNELQDTECVLLVSITAYAQLPWSLEAQVPAFSLQIQATALPNQNSSISPALGSTKGRERPIRLRGHVTVLETKSKYWFTASSPQLLP